MQVRIAPRSAGKEEEERRRTKIKRTKKRLENRKEAKRKRLEECQILRIFRPAPMGETVAIVVSVSVSFSLRRSEDVEVFKTRLPGVRTVAAPRWLVWTRPGGRSLEIYKNGRISMNGIEGFDRVRTEIADAISELAALVPEVETVAPDDPVAATFNSLSCFSLQHDVNLRKLADDPCHGQACTFNPEQTGHAIYQIAVLNISASIAANGSVQIFGARKEEDVRLACFMISAVMANFCS